MREKQYTSYIKLTETRENKLLVFIDDYEIYDFIDDIFTEKHDINFFYQELNTGKYVINIQGNKTFTQIDEILLDIDYEEIDRIYKLNN